MSNGVYDLKWGQDLAGQITSQIKDQVKGVRGVRPLMPIVAGAMAYVKTVPDMTVTAGGAGITVDPSGTLAPIKLSKPFVVRPEQFDDLVTISQLALNAGYDVASTEDAVLLFGPNAAIAFRPNPLPATDESGTLPKQAGLLAAVPAAAIGTPIDQSILAGIALLRGRRHFGPYCVVLSPDSHKDAFKPIKGSAVATIQPILKQLREEGVQFSPSLPRKSGVIFSVGKAAIDLVIPWDLHVECREVKGDATFVVIEQFRLRVNDPNASVALS